MGATMSATYHQKKPSEIGPKSGRLPLPKIGVVHALEKDQI
jgi:hypothetical protein